MPKPATRKKPSFKGKQPFRCVAPAQYSGDKARCNDSVRTGVSRVKGEPKQNCNPRIKSL